MSDIRIAIHVCTGDRGAEATVDLWLERDGFRVQRFEDVYSVCAHLVTHRDRPPGLVVVGASWLTRDELAIIGYFEQTWPVVPLVAYGFSADVGRVDLLPNVRVCHSGSELRALLESPPSALLPAVSAPLAASNKRLEPDHAVVPEPDDPATGPSGDHGNTNGKRPKAPPGDKTNSSSEPTELSRLRIEADAAPRRAVSDEIELTREELAALLEESDR